MTTEQQRDAAIAQAAGYIAGAIATFYGGPAAGSVADQVVEGIAGALLSADDDKYQKEIIERLSVIEGKIDTILRFLNVQLRDLMLETLGENEIRNIVISFHSDMVELKIAVGMFKVANPKTITDGDRIVDAANKVMSSGYKLFVRNQGRFIVAIPYVAHAFASLQFCRSLNTERYDQALGIWASNYRDQIAPWLMQAMPGGTTFPQALKAAIDELALAKDVMQDFIKAGQGVPIRYVVGVAQIGNFASLAMCADFTLNADNTTSSNYIGGVGSAYPVYLQSGSNISDLAAAAGAREHPTIRPFFGPAAGISHATEYWRYYTDSFASNFYHSAEVLAKVPDRIIALKFVIDTLDPFVNGLGLLASLKINDQALMNALAAKKE